MSAIIYIDVREPYEFQASHFDGAINIPLSTLPSNPKLTEFVNSSKLVVYCNSGGRSNAAQQILKAQGFSNVINGINQQQLEQST